MRYKQEFLNDPIQNKESFLFVVDLMGSENLDAAGNQKETVSINEDLSCLQQHIKNTKGFAYRNSNLCKILKGSIGGNSRTALLVTLTPHFSA
jgi:hypothetical protein